MNALYAQHFRKTDSCPDLEMRTFASDSKSEQKCTLEHTFSHKSPSSSLRGSSGALSPSMKTGPKAGPCLIGTICWFSCLASLQVVQASGSLQILLLPMRRSPYSSDSAVSLSTGRCFPRLTTSETIASSRSLPFTHKIPEIHVISIPRAVRSAASFLVTSAVLHCPST